MATNTSILYGPSISQREFAEIARSAGEASKFVFTEVDQGQVDRYLDPSPGTPFGLEYAFSLLGDIRNKRVVDLGSGKGETIIPLAQRGAFVTGIDISPELTGVACRRIAAADVTATARVGSAYATELDSESVDVIFCSALIHHLDIPRVRDEMYRILKKGGIIVLSEPIRFSKLYDFARRIFPAQADTSEFEHPLTAQELTCFCEAFTLEKRRFFRLPFVAIPLRLFGRPIKALVKISAWMIRTMPTTEHFATNVVVRLRKPA